MKCFHNICSRERTAEDEHNICRIQHTPQQYRHSNLIKIDCWETEKELKTTPCSECALNALATNESPEYARLYFEGSMQMLIDAEDSLELW